MQPTEQSSGQPAGQEQPGQPDTQPPVILASGSPRRRELLGNLGVHFEVVVSGADEDSPQTDPAQLARELAYLKGQSVVAAHPGRTVIAADTVVAQQLPGQAVTLLAKPANAAENEAFLQILAGQTHQVYTGVVVFSPNGTWEGVERTEVTFRPLTKTEVAFYARSGEGLDKAGGYGIQGIGMGLVARIEGDYSNIVGFPLPLVIRLLRQAGVAVWDEHEMARHDSASKPSVAKPSAGKP